FIPATGATEVSLSYVQNFLEPAKIATYLKQLKPGTKAIYIGSERYPHDRMIAELSRRNDWPTTSSRIVFVIKNHAPHYVALPRGFLGHEQLWKKYSELAGLNYDGQFRLHFLDKQLHTLAGWQKAFCVHESGQLSGKALPVRFDRAGFRLEFRQPQHAQAIGHWLCTNLPGGERLAELLVVRTDIALEAKRTRFSFWKDAQPLRVKLRCDRNLPAGLVAEIVPEIQQGETEFFLGGERSVCRNRRCQPKRFVLPQLIAERQLELAFRGEPDNFFQGRLRLLSGEMEVATTPLRILPHSWLNEIFYTLLYASEYRNYFLVGLALFLAFGWLIYFLLKKTHRLLHQKSKNKNVLPLQCSAMLELKPGQQYTITATNNPFGCELWSFGSIVRLEVTPDAVYVQHGTQHFASEIKNFCYRLPDGYTLDFRVIGQKLFLYLYRLSAEENFAPIATAAQIQQPKAVGG
ncbi:MAG: hypothetical protein N2Z22_03545, partial [Turneriella sp.]|nr:hypothetical protein [Turneriella sp.]